MSVAHSILRRCVDGGWLSMVACLIQTLHVPIIRPDDLRDFFVNAQVSYLSFEGMVPLDTCLIWMSF